MLRCNACCLFQENGFCIHPEPEFVETQNVDEDGLLFRCLTMVWEVKKEQMEDCHDVVGH